MRYVVTSTFALLVFFTVVAFQAQSLSAEENGTIPAQEKPTVTEEEKATFIEVYSMATILPKELIDLRNKIEEVSKVAVVEKELPVLSEEIEEIRWDTIFAQSNPQVQLQTVAALQEKNQRVILRLQKLSDMVMEFIETLSKMRKTWKQKKERVTALENNEDIQVMMVTEQYDKVMETIDVAMSLIEKNLQKALLTGKKIGDQQIILYSIKSDLLALDQEIKLSSTQQTAPSILSPEFYSQITLDLITQSFNRTNQVIADRLKNLRDNILIFIPLSLLFLLIYLAIKKSRDLIQSSSRWYVFAKCPLATAVFMISSFAAIYNLLPSTNTVLLEQWRALLHIVTLLAVIRLTKYLVTDKDRRGLLKRLTLFMVVTLTFLLLGVPNIIISIYVFYASLVAVGYYFYMLPAIKGKKISDTWIEWVWGIFPAMVLVSGVIGYDQLAVMAFLTLLSTVIACLIVWILYLMNLGLLELTLSLLPFGLLRDSANTIIDGFRPIIIWAHLFILTIIQCVIWDIYPTINIAYTEVLNLGFEFVGLHVSPRFVFTVVLVFYTALLASKAVQVVLLKQVLPRYKAERGVQLSIARLVHYAIVTIGFLIMLKVLGFQLSQLTLLGGALGVGIGFGLQAIVNNFASGLILLFERPIKVGDTIQIGTEWGEVKQLGLRATVIQTFDNAEIVVPNSDLITGQVTNWTLGDRKVRVRIPVGVAYGTDVTKVLEILLACGKANPMVLDRPQPAALFLAFGASSLDFELRVWIPEFLDKLQVLSELNQDIDSEFAANGIEIPFPQSDLHLRTIGDEAGAKLRGRDASEAAKVEAQPES
ncbi:MAG: mechanosensitive ion channel family protein [Desulforhopalus sp.]